MNNFVKIEGQNVPKITGAKGGGGQIKNTLFSTDVLILLTGLGEGPFYRINPNGPQDIQIADGAIDSLINIDGDGQTNSEEFLTATAMGTLTQAPLDFFGDRTVTPQSFSSPVALKKGNTDGIPESKVTTQETSANDWDTLDFNFLISALLYTTAKGEQRSEKVGVQIDVYPRTGALVPFATVTRDITGKTDTPFKVTIPVQIPFEHRSINGYRFSISKITNEKEKGKNDDIQVIGWNEIKHEEQAYPRTALIGYALKAVDEYTGGLPTFTSLAKGLLCKVPSNYNQPVLADGQIDWREVEVSHVYDSVTPSNTPLCYRTTGYSLQNPGPSTKLFAPNIEIYKGTWDGTFVYSWTQNPVWIIYDLLTNKTYGLGIPENNIDKYRFYQIAQYCDACDPTTGYFVGVDGLPDGSFRYKPRGYRNTIRDNQIGIDKGSIKIKERRFISDISIVDQEKSIDILNKIASTFRAVIIYNGGKISLAIDMPEEYPVMLFNDANIKEGSIQFSGSKESDIFTSIEATYIEPSNHFKRETVKLDLAESNKGISLSNIDNTLTLDLFGVTRRSQAMRTAQYHLASSKYLRRSITFTTGTDALTLSAGDVISVATNSSGLTYGYGGKLNANSVVGEDNVYIEHFTVPAISDSTISANTNPLALRVLSLNNDTQNLYIVSNNDYDIYNSDNVSYGVDTARLSVISKFNPITKTFNSYNSFTEADLPLAGDLWSLGEIINPSNYYSSKSSKLYKITNLDKNPAENEVTISALEYISDVYIDSEDYINYEPVVYTDITSPFSSPPTPAFEFTARPRRRLDGSLVVDGYVYTRSQPTNYLQDFKTEYFIAQPEKTTMANAVAAGSPLACKVSNVADIVVGDSFELSGKNGFSTNIGELRLLCTAVDTPTPGQIELTLRGLSECEDINFNQHVLEVNDGQNFSSLKGVNRVQIPVLEKSAIDIQQNFVGYYPRESALSQEIVDMDISTNKISITNSVTGSTPLYDKLPSIPFYVSLNQILASDYYANNSFYVSGSSYTYKDEGVIPEGTETLRIVTEIVPVAKSQIKLYVDGIQQNAYTLTKNSSNAFIDVNVQNINTKYRLEIDHYTVPAIELGDLLEITNDSALVVSNCSYDSSSALYNANLTNNNIFRIETENVPNFDVSGYKFTNTNKNPVGIISAVSGDTVTLNYNTDRYPGNFNLINNRIYTLFTGSGFEPTTIPEDGIVPDLASGTTFIRAQNKNRFGRISKSVTKHVNVESLPIQKVQNILLEESLYREQTGGVSSRITVVFDHILNQEVTDYEISYKFDEINDFDDDVVSGVASYNSVKLSADGVDIDGKMRYTINNVNRGKSSEQSSITIRITPLNKLIRGISAIKTQTIVGKTAPPANIKNFTGGQQSDQVTFFWQYEKIGNDLKDIDTAEVVIRRVPGAYPASMDVFLAADPYVTISAGSVRKAVPIDYYGTYTYLVATRDTSGNLSTTVEAITLTTSRPNKSTVVAAYSEDSPNDNFSTITNTNASENNYPSFNDTVTQGLAVPNGNATDNANASSSGWGAVSGSTTDLRATDYAEYITQIRDFGSIITASISLDLEATQELNETYNDQKTTIYTGVIDSATATSITDSDSGGIGTMLGYGIPSLSGRYDANNRTWMTGSSSGNVWALWNPGQYVGDDANANSYALIASVLDGDTILLGETFWANGEPTGGNTLSNLTSGTATYELVNLTQFNDLGTQTYQGTLGVITAQTLIRTSTDSSVYHANGNVNISTFAVGSGDGFVPYEAGTRVFRHAQFKHVITNNNPDSYNYFLDKFRYTFDKEETTFTATVPYSASPTIVDISSKNFIYRPSISYTILNKNELETNVAVVVTTAASASSLSFKIFAADGSGEYPSDSSATVMITATGV